MKIFATAAECSVVGETDDEYLLSFLVSERQISGLEVPICHNTSKWTLTSSGIFNYQ